MTHQEVERRLRLAADALPEPQSIHAPTWSKPSKGRRYGRIWLLAAVLLVLSGLATAAAVTEVPETMPMWVGFSDFPGRYGVHLAERYGDLIRVGDRTYCNVPEGTTVWSAMVDPQYRWFGVDYQNYSKGETRPDDYAEFSLRAGPMDDPYWRTCFSMDLADRPIGLRNMLEVVHGPYTLYCGEYPAEQDGGGWLYVKWVDYEEGFVYSICFDGALNDRETALALTLELLEDMRPAKA